MTLKSPLGFGYFEKNEWGLSSDFKESSWLRPNSRKSNKNIKFKKNKTNAAENSPKPV